MAEENIDITSFLAQKKSWKIEKYTRSDPNKKTEKDEKIAKCELIYKNENDGFSFSFINDNFLGMKTKFSIKASKRFIKNITEPFKKIKINISEEYSKWFSVDAADKHIHIDMLTKTQKTAIEKFRMKAWKYEGIDDEFSEKIYKKLIDLNDQEAYRRYAKFLRKQEKYDNAIWYLEEAIKNYKNKKKCDNLLNLYLENVISYFKAEKKTYLDAFSLLKELKKKIRDPEKKKSDYKKLLFIFLLLLRKYNNCTEIDNYINNDQELKEINEKIDNVVVKNPKTPISGFLIWIDLIDSTKLKIDKRKSKEWYKKIFYFLNMTTVIFDTMEYETLKYIGDEVMLFKQIKQNEKKDDIISHAKQIYDFIFDKQRWYFGELERFYPNEKFYVKICISFVKKVIKLEDINKEDKHFDILGSDIDFSSRIKGLAKKNLVVANDKYVDLLRNNKGNYSTYFKEYKWKDIFKGSKNEIIYYAEKIDQDLIYNYTANKRRKKTEQYMV